MLGLLGDADPWCLAGLGDIGQGWTVGFAFGLWGVSYPMEIGCCLKEQSVRLPKVQVFVREMVCRNICITTADSRGTPVPPCMSQKL